MRSSPLAQSRRFARIGAAVAAVGVLAAALLWFIPPHIDQSRWIGWYEQQASIATGRAVTIGKISVHLLPTPGIDAAHITIANPTWAVQPFLVQIDHLSARFRVASLWHRSLQISYLKADGVQLDIETAAAQPGNWQMATPNHPARQADANQLSALRSAELQRVTLRVTLHATREKHVLGPWQLPNVHIDSQSPGRDIKVVAQLTAAQRKMTLSASLDALTAPSHAALTLASADANVIIDARRLKSAQVLADTFAVHIDAMRLDQLLAFFQIESRPIAPLQFNADVRADGNKINFAQLAGRLGTTLVGGSAQLDLNGAQSIWHAQLSIPRLDWVHMLADAGRPPLPPKPPGELFRTHRLPWHMLAAAHGFQAKIELHIASLKTRSKIELSNVSTQVEVQDGQLQANAIRAQMLGGTVSGTLHLIGADQSARLNLQLHNVSLHDGLRAMGKTTPLSGGTMQLNAMVQARGESMKALAATLTGPVTITLGPTRIATAAGAHSEEMLTGFLPYFSARGSAHGSAGIHMECASATLPFQAGRAAASPLIGVRSDASELLTAGNLDLRTQTLDLRGRVRSRSGLSLGVSAFGGDIRVSGLLLHPRAKLDPAGTPGAVARIAAAIATAGLSVIGTALWDHVHPGANPCEVVLAQHASTRAATRRSTRSPKALP